MVSPDLEKRANLQTRFVYFFGGLCKFFRLCKMLGL